VNSNRRHRTWRSGRFHPLRLLPSPQRRRWPQTGQSTGDWDTTTLGGTSSGASNWKRDIWQAQSCRRIRFMWAPTTATNEPRLPAKSGPFHGVSGVGMVRPWPGPALRRVDRGLREFLLPSTDNRAPYVGREKGFTMSPPSASSVASTHRVSAMARTMVRTGKSSSRTRPRRTSSGNWTCAPAWASSHEASNSEVLPVGDLLLVSTSNGQNEGHRAFPRRRARV